MTKSPNPGDQVEITIKENNQVINGVVKGFSWTTEDDSKRVALCAVKLDDGVKLDDSINIFPALTALIDFGDGIKRSAIINYINNDRIELYGIDFNEPK